MTIGIVSKVSDELLPCPFCGNHLVRSEFRSTRSVERREHPADVDCILSGVIISMEDRDDDAERRAAWNRRAALEAVSSIHEAEPMIASLIARLRGGVPIVEVRWPGDDGSGRHYQIGIANGLMAEAADLLAHPAPISNGVTAKALEWKDNSGPEYAIRWDGFCGDFHYVARAVRHGDMILCAGRYHQTIEQAKAAAQTEFNARILSCLSHTAGEP